MVHVQCHTFPIYFVVHLTKFHFAGPSQQVFDDIPVTEDLTTELIVEIGADDWKMIGRHLRIEERELGIIDRENKQVLEKIMEMLDKWMERSPPESVKVSVLVTALVNAGRRDVAEKVEGIVLQLATEKNS